MFQDIGGRIKGRAKGSPLARGLYRRASTAEADPQTRPGAPAGAGVRANAPAPTAAPAAVGEKRFKSPRNARLRAGFTLIEALIGMAITGIALLGMVQLFLISIANNTRGGEISQATFLAQQRIDYLRSLTDAEFAGFPSVARGESVDEQLDMNQDGTLDYRRITQVQVSGHAYTAKVLVFPASQNGVAKDTLLQDPSSYRLRAEMNTVISR